MSPAADRIASGTMWMAKLLAEKPDALILKQACVDCRIVSGNCAAMSSRQVSAGVVFELFVVA